MAHAASNTRLRLHFSPLGLVAGSGVGSGPSVGPSGSGSGIGGGFGLGLGVGVRLPVEIQIPMKHVIASVWLPFAQKLCYSQVKQLFKGSLLASWP